LVFNPEIIFDPSVHLHVRASPVLYGGDAAVAVELAAVIDTLEASPETIAAVDSRMVAHVVAGAIHSAMLSSKHHGFAEEREWRILALGERTRPRRTGEVGNPINWRHSSDHSGFTVARTWQQTTLQPGDHGPCHGGKFDHVRPSVLLE
jgi:hypothetical protein